MKAQPAENVLGGQGALTPRVDRECGVRSPRSHSALGRLAGHARSAARLCALGWVMFTAGLSFTLRRPHRRNLAARARWLQHTCRRTLRALGIDVRETGQPPKGAVVAANHLGYVDVLVLAAAAPAVFVAKREVARWPIFGWFARAAGTRFLDREKRSDVARVGAEFTEPIDAEVNAILFLEGTSTDGRDVLPFRSSLLEPAVRHGWPTVPVAIDYEVSFGRSAADEVCWWGDMTLMPHLWNLASLPRVEARVAWGTSMRGTERKQLATNLRDACLKMRRKIR